MTNKNFFKNPLDRADNRCIITGVMVDNTNFEEFIMQKFSFIVDIVSDSSDGVDVEAVRRSLQSVVNGQGTISAVHSKVKTETLAEQGYKVWAKRVAGVSLAAPKPVKTPKAPKAEAVATA